ncbi:hypothetical protein DACRYDRAFT_119293 [Dacryopinax primogenitus]|uniref:CASTOR ACT domain-containing protein n=1 Tax=Dacryopinax primogenitus (strain DJM 731) TaxID=1858805 RepID=M5FW74_DACPD|nr:uncharacterized protein DACRYDRAFT_119293 [Dacryopinax primogenitus]EJT97626.1 hypothetical protein DACRYDRAFT_119293 [Dacryopinax primogenitus]
MSSERQYAFAYPYLSPPPSPSGPSHSRPDSLRSPFSYPYPHSRSPSISTLNVSENQTTLTILPTTLSLVNIPRQRAVQGEVCVRIMKNLLTSLARTEFLAIVANELELSIYADPEVIRRTRLIRMAKKEHRLARDPQHLPKPGWKPIEYSSKRWSVLQVDTHDDEDGGTRMHQISSCLSSAGIPILFVSSHSADFVLVKSALLPDVVGRLRREGFGIYDEHGASPYLTSVGGQGGWTSEQGEDVLVPPLSLNAAFDLIPASPVEGPDLSSLSSPAASSCPSVATIKGPEYYVNPIRGSIACVGLAEEHYPQWLIKVLRLVADPHEILLDSGRKGRRHRRQRSSANLEGRDDERDLDDMMAEEELSEESSSSGSGGSSASDHSLELELELENEYDSDGSASSHSSRDSSSLSAPCHSPTPSMSSIPHPPLRLPMTPPRTSPEPIPRPSPSNARTRARSASAPQPTHPAILALPFFSFIRTRGATSLTASTRVLARLFEQGEREMVMSAGELERFEESEEGEDSLGLELGMGSDHGQEREHDLEGEELAEQGFEALHGPLRCLQIDFSAFGLDKVGLATRISDALLCAKINHLYTSTLRTANVFVSEERFERARRVLLELA